MGNIYTEAIVDYYQHPRKKGTIAEPTAQASGHNPSCGDSVSIQVRVSKGRISQARFMGSGCAISTAASSMLMEKVEGMRLSEARNLSKKDALALLGIGISHARLNCALLPLRTLKEALGQEGGEKMIKGPGKPKERRS